MIGIESIGSYIPRNIESNFAKKADFGIDDDFIVNKIGVEQVSRKSPDEETSDLCVKAFERLQTKASVPVDGVDCIVVCTQHPDGRGIPHTSAVIHDKLGMPERCACFDISLGCSGYVYAMSIIHTFMTSNGMRSGLLFTADPYSKSIDLHDKNTVLLFGDAATVTYFKSSRDGSGLWIPGKFLFATRGKEGDALNNRNKYLTMNGRAIFNFAIGQVPNQIRELLKEEDLTHSDIDLFLFHQGSRYIVDQIRRMLKLPEDKVPVKIAKHGNTVSSSIPLMLEDYLHLKPPKKIAMCGFGVGLSLASCILYKS